MASSNSTLPDVERPGTSSMASSSLDPEKERRNPMLSDGSTSTRVPSALEKEKEEMGNASISKDDEAKAEAVEPPVQDASEYPQGTSLAFIVVALVLSIFLASLDMVADPCPSSTVVCRN